MPGASGFADRVRMPSMKKGGMVKKTGPVRLHKGEMVIPANVVKKLMKK